MPFSYSQGPVLNTPAVCGELVYSATFDGELVDEDTMPDVNVVYSNINNAFGIYSEDSNLIGERKVTVTAHMANYPQMQSQDWYDILVIVGEKDPFGPCSGQTPVEAPRQKNPSKYYYTGEDPSLQFELVPFVTAEKSCKITYSC